MEHSLLIWEFLRQYISGGYNYHSVYEFVSIQAMRKAKEVIKNIVTIIGKGEGKV